MPVRHQRFSHCCVPSPLGRGHPARWLLLLFPAARGSPQRSSLKDSRPTDLTVPSLVSSSLVSRRQRLFGRDAAAGCTGYWVIRFGHPFPRERPDCFSWVSINLRLVRRAQTRRIWPRRRSNSRRTARPARFAVSAMRAKGSSPKPSTITTPRGTKATAIRQRLSSPPRGPLTSVRRTVNRWILRRDPPQGEPQPTLDVMLQRVIQVVIHAAHFQLHAMLSKQRESR